MIFSSQMMDPFHRDLHKAIQEKVEVVEGYILDGHCHQETEYAAKTSYLRALREVLELCEDMEKARYGLNKGES